MRVEVSISGVKKWKWWHIYNDLLSDMYMYVRKQFRLGFTTCALNLGCILIYTHWYCVWALKNNILSTRSSNIHFSYLSAQKLKLKCTKLTIHTIHPQTWNKDFHVLIYVKSYTKLGPMHFLVYCYFWSQGTWKRGARIFEVKSI